MVKVKTLKPPQTYIIMIILKKHPSQLRTLKLHVSLHTRHHWGKVTTLQRLRLTILLLKSPRKMRLVILEYANTTYATILTLIAQKTAEIDVSKILFWPFFVCHSYSTILSFSHTHHSTFSFSLFWGQIHINTNHQQKQQYNNKQSI